MNTIKGWLSSRHAKRAKLAIVSFVVGLFTRDLVVSLVGKQTINDFFVNERGLILVILIVLATAFIVYKPAFSRNSSDNQSRGFTPHS